MEARWRERTTVCEAISFFAYRLSAITTAADRDAATVRARAWCLRVSDRQCDVSFRVLRENCQAVHVRLFACLQVVKSHVNPVCFTRIHVRHIAEKQIVAPSLLLDSEE